MNAPFSCKAIAGFAAGRWERVGETIEPRYIAVVASHAKTVRVRLCVDRTADIIYVYVVTLIKAQHK